MRFIPIITVLLTPMLAFGGKKSPWKVFSDENARAGFTAFLQRYEKALPIERKATEVF